MELNQIRYFLNLADTLNFTEAAMRSGVSQPTLTRAIQRLEQELGGTLVYRDGKDSRLTALGRDIRSEFAAIADSEQRVRAISLNRVRGRREVLTLGIVNTIAPALVTGFVSHALRQMPALELVLRPITRDEGLERLLGGQIDGCFCTDPVAGNNKIASVDNITFHGRYQAPADLAGIYAGMDIVWAGDFMEAGYNSVWLLPNRLYEGGYYAVPPIAPALTQTAAWIEEKDVGFSPPEDLSATLPALVEALIADRSAIASRRERLLDLPVTTFVQQLGAHRAVIEAAMSGAGK